MHFLSEKFNSEDFWKKRERAVKVQLIKHIIDYCYIYELLHGSENAFNTDSVKAELTDMIDTALRSFLSDNDN